MGWQKGIDYVRIPMREDAGMLSILTATTLFPNDAKPTHGAFVATRLAKLCETGEVSAEVLAPVPWLPPHVRYPDAGRLDLVPRQMRRGPWTVWHPRYLVIPRIGMTITPHTLYLTMRKTLRRMIAEGRRFDLIDAHYFYPDGVAAVRLAREFGLPVVVTARGTDINLIPEFPAPRRMILDAAHAADALITVCQALKDRMVDLGVPADRIAVLRNGVDLTLFHPEGREAARQRLDFRRRTIGSVGWLIERKGHHHVIAALPKLPGTDLVIAGEGPERARLERLAASLGVSDRVRFLGSLDQRSLAAVYRALDALVLASSREGWANVLLESMACGTPVVASSVWGTPEVVATPAAGVLMRSLDGDGVAEGVTRLFSHLPNRTATRAYAEQFSWDATTQGQLRIFRHIVAERRACQHRGAAAAARATSPHL
jgi:glycosyltransferase involved in cell wall biosynthesis